MTCSGVMRSMVGQHRQPRARRCRRAVRFSARRSWRFTGTPLRYHRGWVSAVEHCWFGGLGWAPVPRRQAAASGTPRRADRALADASAMRFMSAARRCSAARSITSAVPSGWSSLARSIYRLQRPSRAGAVAATGSRSFAQRSWAAMLALDVATAGATLRDTANLQRTRMVCLRRSSAQLVRALTLSQAGALRKCCVWSNPRSEQASQFEPDSCPRTSSSMGTPVGLSRGRPPAGKHIAQFAHRPFIGSKSS